MTATSCSICQRQTDNTDFVVYQDDDWTVRHSQETNILGYVLIESRRHFLDLSEATEIESSTFGPLLREVISAVRASIKPERVYTFTLAEVVPHFHVHVIPRTNQMPRAFRGRGILQYPVHPPADPELMRSICLSLKRRLRAFAPISCLRKVAKPVGTAKS